jgi:tetratricopeptide (TPR) repeat protein
MNKNRMQSQQPKHRSNSVLIINVILASMLPGLLISPAAAQSRRIKKGSSIPEFKTAAIDQKVFEYKHSNKKALLIAFLSADQKRSVNAAEDLFRIVSGLKCDPGELDFVVVINKPEAKEYLKVKDGGSTSIAPKVIVDTDIKLWGLFGIIATPTVIIGDPAGKAAWIKAGYGYDFAPVIKARLNQALGIAQDIDPDEASKVKVANNNSDQARIERYLQMAKTLIAKQQYESALMMAKKAVDIDPNSIDTVLVVGELQCLIGDSAAALKAVSGIRPENRFKKAKLALVKGWASRRSGDFESAEKYLLESVQLSPRSARGLFELGNLYRATQRPEKAAQSYHSALSLLLARER